MGGSLWKPAEGVCRTYRFVGLDVFPGRFVFLPSVSRNYLRMSMFIKIKYSGTSCIWPLWR